MLIKISTLNVQKSSIVQYVHYVMKNVHVNKYSIYKIVQNLYYICYIIFIEIK